MIADKIKLYNAQNNVQVKLKAVFFDMDGVIYDSMPYHAEAWIKALAHFGATFTPMEVYQNEGRTGSSTINEVFKRQLNREATEEEIQEIYALKSKYFDELNTTTPMRGVANLLKKVKESGLTIYVVTGSGQKSLLEKLEKNFPGIFERKRMITAEDVKIGKPHPEPYLKALEKACLMPNEAVVVENAPLGIRSANAAGIFTIAVNTGILPDSDLENAGANIVYPSMEKFAEKWNDLVQIAK